MALKILAITTQSDRPESALLCGLAERGHKVKVIGKLQQDFKNPLIEEIPLEIKNRFDFSASKLVNQQIHEFDPDIVHAFSGRGLAAAARCKGRFKLIAYRGTVGHLSRLDPASRFSFLSPRVDAISCVSKAVKDYLLLKGVAEEKLFVVYKGHQINWYNSLSGLSLSKESLGFTKNDLIVICVANSRPVKGVDILIEAANLLKNDAEIKFILVGEIRDKNLFSQSKNPNLHFLGFRNDAQALIGGSDLLVVPSRSREGLPKALLEAMALQKPIIASRVGGIPEIIEHGLEGILIPPSDPEILSKAIKYLKNNSDQASQMAKNAFFKLQDMLTVEKMLASTELMYSACLSR